jgi:hypothetical protein
VRRSLLGVGDQPLVSSFADSPTVSKDSSNGFLLAEGWTGSPMVTEVDRTMWIDLSCPTALFRVLPILGVARPSDFPADLKMRDWEPFPR